MGKPNPLKTFVNAAFTYTTTLLKELTGERFMQNGVLRLPKEGETPESFYGMEAYMDVPYERRDEGYFFPGGGLISPDVILEALLQECDTYFGYQVTELVRDDGGLWCFEGFKARNVVLATGAYVPLIDLPFTLMRGVWGERIRIETPTRTTHNYHKRVSVSTTVNGNQLLIGATHKKNHDWFIDENTPEELLKKAAEILPITDAKVLEIKAGMRPGSVDYFPILGSVVDVEASIREFASIRHGSRVPKERLPYIPGLWLHTGHGGRGYVTALSSGRILAEKIVNNIPIPEELDMVRFFYRWIRREYKPE
jgi:glycine/D-amino acid oxidase-like deaminating enzyme